MFQFTRLPGAWFVDSSDSDGESEDGEFSESLKKS
jgi:hypothetical protein